MTAPDGGSLIDEVQKLLDKATEARSKRLRIADKAAEIYAPAVHLTALVAAIGWFVAGAGIHQAIIVATTVLIITCPCALALAIPAVQVAASGALFRKGVFLNAGDAIERLAEVDTVVFDKTGTLTLPEPGIANTRRDSRRHCWRPRRGWRSPATIRWPPRWPSRARGEAPFAEVSEEPGRGISRHDRRRRGAARQPGLLRRRRARRRRGDDLGARLPPWRARPPSSACTSG